MADKRAKVIHSRTANVIATNMKYATSFKDRLIGLMFKERMEGFDGLLIRPCNSIHTFFMKYNIDVIFLNRDNKIVKIVKDLRPWRMTWIKFSADKVLELNSNVVSGDIEVNDTLELSLIHI